MGSGCGLNNNSCSGTFKFKLQSDKKKENITTGFLQKLLRNDYGTFKFKLQSWKTKDDIYRCQLLKKIIKE